jgi:hypothetical protein
VIGQHPRHDGLPRVRPALRARVQRKSAQFAIAALPWSIRGILPCRRPPPVTRAAASGRWHARQDDVQWTPFPSRTPVEPTAVAPPACPRARLRCALCRMDGSAPRRGRADKARAQAPAAADRRTRPCRGQSQRHARTRGKCGRHRRGAAPACARSARSPRTRRLRLCGSARTGASRRNDTHRAESAEAAMGQQRRVGALRPCRPAARRTVAGSAAALVASRTRALSARPGEISPARRACGP